jgi:hypothetical protein
MISQARGMWRDAHCFSPFHFARCLAVLRFGGVRQLPASRSATSTCLRLNFHRPLGFAMPMRLSLDHWTWVDYFLAALVVVSVVGLVYVFLH